VKDAGTTYWRKMVGGTDSGRGSGGPWRTQSAEDLRRGTRTHPSGVTGVSVESAEGLSLEELARALPHGQVGVTTVGAIRAAGGDIVRTLGRSLHHATMVGLTPEAASRLLTPTIANPAKKP
jgi:hypothetical protein